MFECRYYHIDRGEEKGKGQERPSVEWSITKQSNKKVGTNFDEEQTEQTDLNNERRFMKIL